MPARKRVYVGTTVSFLLVSLILVFSKGFRLAKTAPDRVSHRTAAGATVLIVSRLIARCIDLATLLVLGRLLSPADFGLVAIAMSIIMIVEAILELPVGQALVRLPVLTKAH